MVMKQIITLTGNNKTCDRIADAIERLSDPNIGVNTYIEVGYETGIIVTFKSSSMTIESIYVECIKVEDSQDEARYIFWGDGERYVTINEVIRSLYPYGPRAQRYVRYYPTFRNQLAHSTVNFNINSEQ